MHAYDAPRPQPLPPHFTGSFQSPHPPVRPVWEREVPEASPTPIFDALYGEYLRSFRALPGDRSGEEDLGFTAFGHGGPADGGRGGAYGTAVAPYTGGGYGGGPQAGSFAGGGYGGASGGLPAVAGAGGAPGGWNSAGWQTGVWQPTGNWGTAPVPEPWAPVPEPRPAYAGHPGQLGPVGPAGTGGPVPGGPGYAAAAYTGGRPYPGNQLPAALPPAPRRGY